MKKTHFDVNLCVRIPRAHHDWFIAFANQWNVSPSYVYRAAIRAFIQSKAGEAKAT